MHWQFLTKIRISGIGWQQHCMTLPRASTDAFQNPRLGSRSTYPNAVACQADTDAAEPGSMAWKTPIAVRQVPGRQWR